MQGDNPFFNMLFIILSLGQLILSLGQLILSLGVLILSLDQLILSLGQLIQLISGGNSVSEVGGGGGRGGGAKLHEFPTLHRFARFTIAYCFTKTTLGHI